MSRAPMQILVVGAGVIGTLLATRLASVRGCSVELVARGARYDALAQGVPVASRGATRLVKLPVHPSVPTGRAWDLVIVAVQHGQAETALRDVAEVDAPSVMTMISSAGKYGAWQEILGPDRLIVGFPGAGGSIRADHALDAEPTPRFIQRTTLGEPVGRPTRRVRELARLLRAAGLPTAVSRRMGDWQFSHLALVCPLAAAVTARPGVDHQTIATDSALMTATAHQIRAHLAAVRRSGASLEPLRMRVIARVPSGILGRAIAAVFRTELGDRVICRHARSADTEMRQLTVALERRLALSAPAGHLLRPRPTVDR